MAVAADHEYKIPKREILITGEMEKWEKCEAYQEYVGFVESMNEAVRGKANSTPIALSIGVESIMNLLDKLDKMIDETPPIEQPQRFGNKAFAQWYLKLKESAGELLREALKEEFHKSIEEIEVYLVESMGNSTRIDYGSGHEMSFIIFMYCLFRIGVLDVASVDDKMGAVNKIFDRYMRLVRKLQTAYNMEPAGSHGVWSLDDFQFVPFIWGSSQLLGHGTIDPPKFIDENILEKQHEDYLFLACIKYIMQVKTGPFHEHSNQLWNISGIPSWTKVNQGLLKMYKAEVLAKFPVIQHTVFGSLFSIEPFDALKRPNFRARMGPGRLPPNFHLPPPT